MLILTEGRTFVLSVLYLFSCPHPRSKILHYRKSCFLKPASSLWGMGGYILIPNKRNWFCVECSAGSIIYSVLTSAVSDSGTLVKKAYKCEIRCATF